MSKYFGEDALIELWQSVIGETVKAARVAVGSYVGKGAYGEENAVKLTFDFEPKFVLVLRNGGGLYSEYNTSMVLFRPQTSGNTGSSTTDGVSVEWGENSVLWYGGNPAAQLNAEFTYNYLAIG